MVNIKEIKSIGTGRRKKMRVGRGPGSGQGKTAGRGHKGYGQRSGTGGKLGFEGGQMPLYRRQPKRGFTNAPFKVTYSSVNVGDLKDIADGESVDIEFLKASGLLRKNARRLKILGGGELNRKLKIKADRFSATARQKIEAAGGEIEESR
jgi:large subunit ribosomal protein L15